MTDKHPCAKNGKFEDSSMSNEQLRAFQKAVQSDPSLQLKLRKAKDPVAIAAVARDAGFDLGSINQHDFFDISVTNELSDHELSQFAGGEYREAYTSTQNGPVHGPRCATIN